MNVFSRYSPRRYFTNDIGERVLIGLSVQETLEFEALDERVSLPGPNWERVGNRNGPIVDEQRRWNELYKKHKIAWQDWLANSNPPR